MTDNATERMRIGIVEDQALVRESLAIVLGLEPDVSIAWTAATGGEAIRLATATPVDLMLIDLRLPDMDGVTLLRRIAPERSATLAVVLTTFPHDEWLLEALQAGATACFSKEVPPGLLIKALRNLRRGRWNPEEWSPDWRRYAPPIQFKGRPAGPHDGLTPREIDLLRQICAGATNGEIALAFNLTEGTVKNYVSTLYAKLGVRHRAEAVTAARERGLW